MIENKTEEIRFRVEPSLKEQIEARAESRGHKLAAYMRWLIKQDLKNLVLDHEI